MYLQNPSAVQPAILLQHDASENGKPWIRNVVTIEGKERPKYTLREGLTVDTAPRPYMEDMVEITDYSSFRKGDRVPAVIGLRGERWGGSKDDIITKAEWNAQKWTIEMGRKLNTGHSDDIQFSLNSSPSYYRFVIIVRDGGKGYAISSPVSLELGR